MLVLVQRPQHKSTPDPVAAPKNIPFGTIFIEFGDTKKCCTFSGLELAPKSRKKLIGALSCMQRGPKCIQSLWDYPKKIPFVQKHKEGAICKNGVFSLRIAHIAPSLCFCTNEFFRMVPEGLNAFGTFVHAAQSAR